MYVHTFIFDLNTCVMPYGIISQNSSWTFLKWHSRISIMKIKRKLDHTTFHIHMMTRKCGIYMRTGPPVFGILLTFHISLQNCFKQDFTWPSYQLFINIIFLSYTCQWLQPAYHVTVLHNGAKCFISRLRFSFFFKFQNSWIYIHQAHCSFQLLFRIDKCVSTCHHAPSYALHDVL
jgi:hypothetical protein